jgi:O-antigen/teichoic acid export membrane protein
MLLRHGAFYVVARGAPAIVSLLAISVYSRLLSPEAYGQYALVIAGVGLANKLVFEWLRLSLLRFLPGYQTQRSMFVSTLFAGFASLLLLTAVLGGAALLAITDPVSLKLIAIGLPLLWIQALFDVHLEFQRSRLSPIAYGAMSLSKALLALAFGVALVWAGFGAIALLLGLLFGLLLPLLPPLVHELRSARPALVDRTLLVALCRYGAPLAMTAALGFIVQNSDRFMIAWLLGDGAVGRYALSYDLANNSVGVVFVVVNLAAYPLVIRALERDGLEAARHQLKQSLKALVGVGLPATVGLIIVAPNAATVLLGDQFQEDAGLLIRWIAVGTLLNQLRAFYFDLAFQLARSTLVQMWVSASSALLNVALNLWWIPAVGIMGAAYATVVSYAYAAVASGLLGRRAFPLPAPDADIAKICLATAGMTLTLWLMGSGHGVMDLVVQIGSGGSAYLGLLWLLNIAGVRSRFPLGSKE